MERSREANCRLVLSYSAQLDNELRGIIGNEMSSKNVISSKLVCSVNDLNDTDDFVSVTGTLVALSLMRFGCVC